MPPRKCPESLYKLSASVFVQSFIRVWCNCYKRQVNYHGQLTVLPRNIADGLIQEAIEKYDYMLYRDFYSRYPDMTFFLQSVIVPELNTLNLALLATSGTYYHELLISKLSLLNNLVKLSLKGSNVQGGLPLCTNEILIEIGKNCQNLKVLNISNNHGLTGHGLQYLIPCDKNKGCPLLEEIFIYNCSIYAGSIANILEKLENLTLVGHNETGLAILYLKQQCSHYKTLKLRVVNNYDAMDDRRDLNCESMLRDMYQSINKMCPDMYKLQIRLKDDDLNLVEHFNSLMSVELLFNLRKVSLSPGSGTDLFFQVHGAQLVSIAITCHQLTEGKIIMLGQTCPQLKCLWLRCNCFVASENCKFTSHIFRHLKSLAFQIGGLDLTPYLGDLTFIKSMLMNSEGIEEVRLSIRSPLIDDVWLKHLLCAVRTQLLKVLVISLPRANRHPNALNLTIDVVRWLIRTQPALKTLGNMSIWNISNLAVERFWKKLSAENYNLEVVFDI